MLSFFDYVFYSICKLYMRAKDDSPEFSAICVMTLFYVLNAISIFFIFVISLGYKVTTDTWMAILACIFFFALNFLRYNRISYHTLHEKWKNESNSIKRKKRIFVLIYLIGSTIVVLILIFRKSIF